MADNLTDTGRFNAIQDAIQEARKGIIKDLTNLILGIQDANTAAEGNKAATLKSKTDELKKRHSGNYRPE